MEVGIQDTFVDALTKLSKTDARRAWNTVQDYRTNPESPGLHVEPVLRAVDDKIYSARVSQSHRAIIVRSPQGDMSLFVWVDQHDKAYQWARNKRFELDSNAGTIRMWSVAEETSGPENSDGGDYLSAQAEAARENVATISGHEPAKLFDGYSDDQLRSLRIPDGTIPFLRNIETSDELDALESDFSPDVMLALQALSTGDPYDEVKSTLEELWREEQEDETDLTFDEGGESPVSPWVNAIRNAGKGTNVYLVQSDEDLEQILSQPLERWRTFLHPLQRSLVEANFNGPVRVLGGAGTGKTVVAMHRARRLVRDVVMPNERLLFTTFSVNLAQSIEQTMQTFCAPEDMQSIDVISIDRLAKRVLDQTGQRFRIIYDDRELDEVWLDALRYCGQPADRLSFVRDEYSRVIQQNGITEWNAYRDVARMGRTIRVSRGDRMKTWQVIEMYRQLMRDRQAVDGIDLFLWARLTVEANPGLLAYRCAVIDEGQDLHPEAYRFIRALIPPNKNDLFIVGDAHQRIYDRKVILGRCGINIRGQRSKRLHINYRTTEQIRRSAMQVLTGLTFDDLDGSTDDGRDISLLKGQAPIERNFTSLTEEQSVVKSDIRKLVETGIRLEDIAILARTRRIADSYAQALNSVSIQATLIHRSEMTTAAGVRCSTMHGSKGLEFRVVFLVSVNNDLFPPVQPEESEMTVEQSQGMERTERSLLYVASTRARDQLFVYSSSNPSRFWPSLRE